MTATAYIGLMGRYRWRTWLRTRLPARPPLYVLVPKGKDDCEDHEWYLVEPGLWKCAHCEVGETCESPWTPEEHLQYSLAGVTALLRSLHEREPREHEVLMLHRLIADAQAVLASEPDRLAALTAAPPRELPGVAADLDAIPH